MWGVLKSKKLYELLEKIDRELAAGVQTGRCIHCGGHLHRADYPRKPRGGPAQRLDRWDRRESFCCERDGCRKRHTPPSVRFLGPKVYLGVVVAIAAAMMHGANAQRIGQVHAALGIDERTLRRWRQWWLEEFPATGFWKVARARFMPPADEAAMPRCLIEAFKAWGPERLLGLMHFLSPITTGSCTRASAM